MATHREASTNFFRSREAISQFLFVSDAPRHVDLCVVLGAPSFTNIEPAIDLFHAGQTKKILITGYGPINSQRLPTYVPEYEALLEKALQAGIPRDVILLEKTATNTLENFVRSSELIDKTLSWEKINTVAIAGKPLHMRRAHMTARKHWPKHLEIVMLPSTSSTDLQRDTWHLSELGRQRVLNEMGSIAAYAQKDDIGGF